MAAIPVITSGMAGVDMKTNPLFLPEERLAGATNVVFEEGAIKTRPGFRYHDLGVTGAFQGATAYSPSRGLSHMPFADPFVALVVAAGGKLQYNLSQDGFITAPVEIKGSDSIGSADINLFQAENYLIVQNQLGNTFWWQGYGDYTVSPGLDAEPDTVKELLLESHVDTKELVGANLDCCFHKIDLCTVQPLPDEEEDFSSHDTLIWEKHRNFLINSAGVGVYANGRIHQQASTGIYVSDLIHKRGTKYTDDILLMEEQQAGSFGDPLSTNSKLGQLRAIELLPSMTNANGEGLVVCYYDFGVVAFDTAIVPRETRYDPEKNQITQQGWSENTQIRPMLNSVSATGRYAVGLLPRDHVFRSRFGIHLLKTSLGEGVFNDEFINTLSQDVQPILDADDKSVLKGVTAGQWVEGSRILTSVGMIQNSLFSSSPMGRGFVVWNQATTFTEDRTPRPMWEGLWSPHCEIAGIHRLLDVSPIGGDNMSGFVASRDDASVLFAEIDKSLGTDVLDDNCVQIEWDVTSRKIFQGHSKLMKVTECRVELEAAGEGGKVRVMVRSDISPTWEQWGVDKDTSDSADRELVSLNFGLPPKKCREVSWLQIRVEGLGEASLNMVEVEISEQQGKMGKVITQHNVTSKEDAYHRFNSKPTSDRWN